MTKKHFEAIAKVLNRSIGSAERIDNDDESANTLILLNNLVKALEYEFEEFNPNFNSYTFREATGINQATKELF